MNTILRTATIGAAEVSNPSRPRWLGERLYPFTSRYVEIDGHKIH